MSEPSRDQAAAAALYRDALASFATARRGGPIARFEIGGHGLRLEFATPALAPFLTPALGHLSSPRALPGELHVGVWDSRSTGTPPPASPWSAEELELRNRRTELFRDPVLAAFQLGEDSLNLLCDAEARALFWRESAFEVPYYTAGAPLRTLLHWWLARRGKQLVHAAAVGFTDGGVLLAGRGGSGKSTTALACLRSELCYAGDDYVVVDAGPEPYVHSLYCSGKLDPGHAHRLSWLVPHASGVERSAGEKLVFLLGACFPEKLVRGFPLRAILVPRVSGGATTRFERTSAAEALSALAPSTLFQFAGDRVRAFQRLGALVRRVPAYRLELGTDIAAIPSVIERLLRAEAAGGDRASV